MNAQPARAFRPSGPGSPENQPFSFADIVTKTERQPNRTFLHAREGFGKTSFGAQAVKPIFIQSRGETGLETLIAANQLPEIPRFPEARDWRQFRSGIRSLIDEDHPYRTLVVDTINGAERLCHEHVCQNEFRGEWGETGFSSYGRGPEVSLAEWRFLINDFDTLREKKGMAILLLSHSKIKTFKNPDGADYDRWLPDMNEKTWSLTHRWLDAVLFGNFEVVVHTQRSREVEALKKGKAAGTSARMLYAQQRPAFDAKNRLGLPEEIECGASAEEAWANYVAALKAGRGAEMTAASVKQEETDG